MFDLPNFEVILPLEAVGILMAHINLRNDVDEMKNYRVMDMAPLSNGRVVIDLYSKYDHSDIESLKDTLKFMEIEFEVNAK